MSRTHDLFLDMLVAERGAAANTVAAYGRDLEDAAGFLAGRKCRLDEAEADDLRAYLTHLTQRRVSPATSARRLSCLRQFFGFLFAEGMRGDNPAAGLEGPKTPRPLPKLLSPEEVDLLLARAAAEPGPDGTRLICLVELLYATGMRVSELVSLPFTAVARDPEMLVVTGKGSKERLVPLSDPARNAIAAYLPERAGFTKKDPENPFLFPSGSK